MWRWADVKMRRCEDKKMWRWADVKMRRCEDEQMWRWEDVKMRRCEDEQMEDEQMWRWEDVKMSRCEDEKMWRWADVKMRRWRWADVKMRRCEDEKVWRWEGVKMRRWDTDPHYWKNPALRRSREKYRKSLSVLSVLLCRVIKAPEPASFDISYHYLPNQPLMQYPKDWKLWIAAHRKGARATEWPQKFTNLLMPQQRATSKTELTSDDSLDSCRRKQIFFPACVARVPVSLWGSEVEGVFARRCVHGRKCPQPSFAIVRDRPRDCYMAVSMVSSVGGCFL